LIRPSRALGLLLLVAGLVLARIFRGTDRADSFSFESGKKHYVERVVDGDTLLLDDGARVRLLGVDTPETKHPDRPVEPFGPEAAEFTRSHVERRHVTLEFDRERRDQYRRVLAYVYLGDWFLNEELIRAGYSRAETRFPYRQSMKRRFLAAEKQARTARRGIWADDDGQE
jgi:micrococcal nuclease